MIFQFVFLFISTIWFLFSIDTIGDSFSFQCGGGDILDIITATEKQDNLEVAYETFQQNFGTIKNPYESFNKNYNMKYDIFSTNIKKKLAENCWKKIDKAINFGEKELLKRHSESFSTKMSRVSLEFGSRSVNNPNFNMKHLGSEMKNQRSRVLEEKAVDVKVESKSIENKVVFKVEDGELFVAHSMFDYGR